MNRVARVGGVQPICAGLTEHRLRIAPSTNSEHVHQTPTARESEFGLAKANWFGPVEATKFVRNVACSRVVSDGKPSAREERLNRAGMGRRRFERQGAEGAAVLGYSRARHTSGGVDLCV